MEEFATTEMQNSKYQSRFGNCPHGIKTGCGKTETFCDKPYFEGGLLILFPEIIRHHTGNYPYQHRKYHRIKLIRNGNA